MKICLKTFLFFIVATYMSSYYAVAGFHHMISVEKGGGKWVVKCGATLCDDEDGECEFEIFTEYLRVKDFESGNVCTGKQRYPYGIKGKL